jgi:HAMP domain-containing protein
MKSKKNIKKIVENGNYPMPMLCKIVTNDSDRPSLESLKETGIEVNQKNGLKRSENLGKKYSLKVTIQIKFRMPLIPNSETTKILIEQNERIDEEKEKARDEIEELKEEIKELKEMIKNKIKK